MRRLPLLLLALCSVIWPVLAQRSSLTLSPFTDMAESQLPEGGERRIIPQRYRTVRLDVGALSGFFQKTPLENTTASTDLPVLTLPLPEGKVGRFRLIESPVMHDDLQRKYPDIRCYIGQGIDDPTATLSCDLTPWGFHAMILSDRMGTVFIDPYVHGDREFYSVYFKKDYQRASPDAPFACSVEDEALTEIREGKHDLPEFQGDCRLRTYRLALACTGEYSSFHGGTVPLVLAAMNTSMNRVNAVFRRELSITMQIIPKNDTLIFLNASSDPYANTNGGTMLNQNTTVCNARIGVANFDIGHVFSTGGGGIASLGSVCNSTNKAKGVTGSGQPIGDAFDIDYVAHEMGHQFGGPHTFNGTLGSCAGNANSATAVEPGSGTTIMAYAGICGANNVQGNSNDYFHASSLQSIGNYTTTGAGNNCPVKTTTGNNAPTVNAGPDYTIPKSTPFYLTATGSDIDGDTLTYCWEQMDAGSGTLPPASTNTVGPMFRSFSPLTNPIRYFPRLSDLNGNINYAWEELPSVARTLKFRVTVRDNNFGSGCTEEDDMNVVIHAAAGPFQVTSPNTNIVWTVGEPQTVTWNVAGSDLAPVSCSHVRILFSNNGGLTYPVVLAENIPNTGTANVTVPNLISSLCRIKVESIGNIFYDISNVNFRVQQPTTPTFVFTSSPNSAQVCAGDSTQIEFGLVSLAGFNAPVQFSVSGGPAAATYRFSPNPVVPTGSTSLIVSDLTDDMIGNYTLTITAEGNGITRTASLALTIKAGKITTPPTLLFPADGQTALPTTLTLHWSPLTAAATYTVEVATSPNFAAGSVLVNKSVSVDSFSLINLAAGVYYWRVSGVNDCGSAASVAAAFQVGKGICNQTFLSTDTPMPISGNAAGTITSVIDVPIALSTNDLNVEINADHEWVGDLSATLINPSGKRALLFDRVGAPADPLGCDGQNLQLLFDDEAPFTAQDLDATCAPSFPALAGNFQPIQALTTLEGSKNVKGDWTLELTDAADESGGWLVSWSLTFCFPDSVVAGQLLTNAPLTVSIGGTGTITETLLSMQASGSADQARYILLSPPQHGTLFWGNTPLSTGGIFTQADLALGLVTYTHHGDNSTADSFRFDALDAATQAWLHDSTFLIRIRPNDLVATGTITRAVPCAEGTGGEITASATGLDGNYLYSLNGGPTQSSPVFTDLAAGTYTVVVAGQYGYTAVSTPIVLTNPPAVEVTATVTDNDLSVTATGGAGDYVYILDGVIYQETGDFPDLPNGSYTITVRDGNGCVGSTTAVVLINTLAVAAQIEQQVSCYGGTDGRLSVSVDGGERPLQTYSLNGGPAQVDSVFENLPAGTYTVVVTDAVGFTRETAPVEITQPDLLTVTVSVSGSDLSASTMGGTAPVMFSVDGMSFQTGSVFEDLPNGVYTLIARDAHGCTATVQQIVAVGVLIALSEVTRQVTCFGGADGNLSVEVGGGQGPYLYSLNGDPYQADATFSGLSAGTYVVEVKDNEGLTTTTSEVVITQPVAVEVMAQADFNLITASASGGAGGFSYSLDGQAFQSDPAFTVLASGTYTVIAHDEKGCTGTASVTVTIPPLTASVEAPSILCNGGTVDVTLSASGGIPPYEYQLAGQPFQSSPVYTGLGAGTYQFTIRDVAGTQQQVMLTLAEPLPLSVNVVVTGNDVTYSASGGVVPYIHSLNGVANADLTDLPNGTYTLVVTDGNGCTTSTTFLVAYTPLTLTVQVTDPVPCDLLGNLTIVALGGVPPYEYAIDNGPYVSNPLFTDIPAGAHTLRVRDAQGEVFTTLFSLNLPALIQAGASIVGDSIVASASGGTGPYTYALNSGAFTNNPVFGNLPTGTYTLIVQDSRGCTASLSGLNITSRLTEPVITWGAALAPNPTSGLLRLSLSQPPALLQVQVVDITGKLLRSLEFSPSGTAFTTVLDLSDLPKGFYALRLTDGQRSGAMKVSLQ